MMKFHRDMIREAAKLGVAAEYIDRKGHPQIKVTFGEHSKVLCVACSPKIVQVSVNAFVRDVKRWLRELETVS